MFDIDLNDHSGGPNWLSIKNTAKRAAIRAKHRAAWELAHSRQRKPVSESALARLQVALDKAEAHEKTREGQRRLKVIGTFQQAIRIMDVSEVELRDLIEREAANFEGRKRLVWSIRAINRLQSEVRHIRTEAIKAAFRHIRDNLSQVPRRDAVARLIAEDVNHVDTLIRSGLQAGLSGSAIAQSVTGTMLLDGMDGATEMTRQKIARMGLAIIKRGK